MYYQSPIDHLKAVNAVEKMPSNKCVTTVSEEPEEIFIYEDKTGSSGNNNKVFGRGLQAFGGRGHKEFVRGRFDRGQGGFIRGRGGFDRGRGGFISGRGGSIRERGGLDRGRGGFIRGRGGLDRGRGGFIRGRGGFDRGRGGFISGRRGFISKRGGFDRGQGFISGRGGFVRERGGFDRGQGFISERGGFDGGRGGFISERGGFDGGRGGFISERRGFIRERGGFDRGKGGFNRGRGNFKKDGLLTKLSKDSTEIVQKVPIFTLDEKLEGELEEFYGWSLQELFVYVKCLHGMADGKTMDTVSWSKLDLSLIGKAKKDLLDRKIVWKKLKQDLPTPTLKESLMYCKMYLLRESVTKDKYPQWLKPPDTLQDLIKEEVKSVFGECEVPGETLIEKLGTAGMMVIYCKLQDKLQKYILSVSHFLKEYPDNFALQYRVVNKRKNIIRI